MTTGYPRVGLATESLLGASGFDSLDVVLLEELLAPPAFDWVITYALEQDHRLVESPLMTTLSREGWFDEGARYSRVLLDVDRRLAELMRSQIRRVLPDVLVRMDYPVVEPTGIDVRLTVTEDAGRFCGHVDASDKVVADRQLTYVLFVHAEPKGFAGGHLRIVDSLVPGGQARRVEVEPVQNRMALFPARYFYEVTDVHVPSGRFEDGHFTVNGWLSW